MRNQQMPMPACVQIVVTVLVVCDNSELFEDSDISDSEEYLSILILEPMKAFQPYLLRMELFKFNIMRFSGRGHPYSTYAAF